MEFHQEDARRLWAFMRREEKSLRLKRRWLMGLPTYYRSGHLQKNTVIPNFLKNEALLESSMRNEDVSAEIITESINRGFEALMCRQQQLYIIEDYAQLFDSTGVAKASNLLRVIISVLDNLNNKALFNLTNILTRNSIKFEKTRPVMKMLIKKRLGTLIGEPDYKEYIEPVKQLLMFSCNFREDCLSCLTPVTKSVVSAANMVLKRLVNLCTPTLFAMDRKLKGIKYVPQLNHHYGQNRERLMRKISRICGDMLEELNEGEELPRPLAKAMAVAALSLRGVHGTFDFPLPEFFHFPPEIEAVQNDILKALQTLPKVTFLELKHIQHILDPKAEMRTKKFRLILRKLLLESLFECGDVVIPKHYLKVVGLINRKSRRKLNFCFSKENMEIEVEYVLNVSAQLSQIMWDMLPEDAVDEEYAEAYMEDSESDDSENTEIRFDDGNSFSSIRCLDASHSDDEVESIGDSRSIIPNILSNVSDDCTKQFNINSLHEPQCKKNGNRYLAIKATCDDVSLIAYHLIGGFLEAFSQNEGLALDSNTRSYLRGAASNIADSEAATEGKTDQVRPQALIQVIEELIPSLPDSGIERVKKLMGM